MSSGNRKASVLVAATAGSLALVALSLKLYASVSRRQQHAEVSALVKEGGNKVYLLTFPKWNQALSVFVPCTKVEAFLRITKIPYESLITDSSVLPTGYLPSIVHNGKYITGSKAIISYLIKEFNLDIDCALTKENKAVKVVMENAIEYTTWPSYYRTLIEGKNHITSYYAQVFGVPKMLAFMFPGMYGQRVKPASDVAGVDHLTGEQLEEEFLRDIESIEGLINGKAFVFGSNPCSLDCTIYALLVSIVMMKDVINVSESFAYVAQSPVLIDYVDRMTRLAFPECSDITKSFDT